MKLLIGKEMSGEWFRFQPSFEGVHYQRRVIDSETGVINGRHLCYSPNPSTATNDIIHPFHPS